MNNNENNKRKSSGSDYESDDLEWLFTDSDSTDDELAVNQSIRKSKNIDINQIPIIRLLRYCF